jgi:NifU-like protein involved in Fe-S cluster formation
VVYFTCFAGSLDKTAKNVGTAVVGAPACGDVMKLQIRVAEDGTIEEAKFKTFGCGSAIAARYVGVICVCCRLTVSKCQCSSVATEWIKGKSIDECLSIKNTDIASHLKLPPVKLHCSMLAEDAVKGAVKDYLKKSGKPQLNEVLSS